MTTPRSTDDVRWRLDSPCDVLDVEDVAFWRSALAATQARVEAYERLVAAAAT